MIGQKLSSFERNIIDAIYEETKKGNIDNISRTLCYKNYYENNVEIIWSLLASFVSRNAGWNMTDLKGELLPKILTEEYCEALFLTYERANWLIFSDAYPQLLIYQYSKRYKKPLFHLLNYFGVSSFMEKEWTIFWEERDKNRLCTSQIINEQHIIQQPVIEDPYYHKHVFSQMLFAIEDRMHFSTVIFPTLNGKLYGFSVHGFTKLKNRILLGKRLAWLLYNSQDSKRIIEFAIKVPHTGSRYDYEKYVRRINRARTPKLLDVYPTIHHSVIEKTDWYEHTSDAKVTSYFEQMTIPIYDITDWYYKKQLQLYTAAKLEQRLLALIR